MNFFPQIPRPRRHANRLENTTLRGFGGGWNAVSSDINMEARFLVTLRNFRRTANGSQRVRFGSKWFADLTGTVASNAAIIDMTYFSDRLIVVTNDGKITAVDGTGAKILIWSSAIAAALPGNPSGWSTALTVVNFVPFKQELIIHNGVDKPITISRALAVTYLQDLATHSNVNVPVGRYGCVVSNYHCIGGLSAKPTTVYISAVGTSGTFPGDPIPNDSISIDVGAFAPQGAIQIRAIAGFRSNLIVFFQDQAVIVKLGLYDNSVTPIHTPVFPDTMPSFGALGHRCIQPVENDLLFAGLRGMSSAKRNLLSVSGSLESSMLSEYVEPAYTAAIGVLDDITQLNNCYMVYDSLAHDMIFITPSGQAFVYSFNEKLHYRSWSEFRDITATCACRSFLGRVFFGSGLRIYQYGNSVYTNESFNNDRQLDRDTSWAASTFFTQGQLVLDTLTGLVYTCLRNHTSSATTFAADRTALVGYWKQYVGVPINFAFELPWLDSKDPMKVKQARFLSLSTKGNAEFTVKAYVDNLYKNDDGVVIWNPALQMAFIGNDAKGEGYDAGPYGGGRRSNDPRLYGFPVKFKTLKLLIEGNTGGNLEIATISFLFNRGRYKR